MSSNFIVVGDTTVSGGAVVAGSPFTDIDGIPIARMGDAVLCGRHGPTVIASGDQTIVIDGQPVARHMLDACACGCTLVSTKQMHVFVDAGGAGGSAAKTSSSIAAAPISLATALGMSVAEGADEIVAYDEAIRFVSHSGTPLGGVRYTLHLASGGSVRGVTDADGITERVVTPNADAIVEAILTPQEGLQSCCSSDRGAHDHDQAAIKLSGIETNTVNIGQSVAEVKTKGHQRSLTSGEIALARSVFADSVDYSRVKVHGHGYWMFFGFQDKHTAVTPNGEMYFPKAIYLDDFSLFASDAAFFVHEMTHVWQHELGYAVRWNGLWVSSRGPEAYKYSLSPGDKLSDFNMEQQADIISDYCMKIVLLSPSAARSGGGTPDALRSVLAAFLSDPSSPANLPGKGK